MTRLLLILRPEPGASETAEKARAAGLDAVLAPIFHILPRPWSPPPPTGFDAVMMTSANAARHAGAGLRPMLHLPCFAVGETTARAAREIGFAQPSVGPADGAALLDLMAQQGITRAFHPCGLDHLPLHHPGITLTDVPVYAATSAEALSSDAVAALAEGALVLLHSPRGAVVFAQLCPAQRSGIRLAAISRNTAEAAGTGWKSVDVASQPRDEALLELAAKLCQTGAEC